jgi:hypothetical protein
MIAASVAPPLVSGVLFQPFDQLFAMCLSLLLFKLPARTSSDVKRSYAKVHYGMRFQKTGKKKRTLGFNGV